MQCGLRIDRSQVLLPVDTIVYVDFLLTPPTFSDFCVRAADYRVFNTSVLRDSDSIVGDASRRKIGASRLANSRAVAHLSSPFGKSR